MDPYCDLSYLQRFISRAFIKNDHDDLFPNFKSQITNSFIRIIRISDHIESKSFFDEFDSSWLHYDDFGLMQVFILGKSGGKNYYFLWTSLI